MATVAVIGAGPAGLASAKAALEYGLTPTVFERAPQPGGLWRPGGFVRPALATNVSRFTSTFSDHAWPAGTPDFPSAPAVADYLTGYAREFGIEPHLHLGCEVVGLEHEGPGWRVVWENNSRRPGDRFGDQRFERRFDAVVVASGFFAEPVVPRLPGALDGLVLHSGDYRDAAQFSGRRVVVVGAAFSGSEIAVELAEAGAAVTAVAPRPRWLLPRCVPSPVAGRPVPHDLFTRIRAARTDAADVEAPERNRRRNRFLDELGGNPGRLGDEFHLDPDSTVPPHVVISDGFTAAVEDGKVALLRGRVARLEHSSAVLGDGRRIPADALVWCTGYRPRLSFLPGWVQRATEYDPADMLQPLLLHDGVFPAEVERLCFVGMYRGPYLGTVELQARWACSVLAGDLPPPGADDVARGIADARRVRLQRPRPQFPYDDMALADRIGRALGVLHPPEAYPDPDGWYWSAPVIPAHYRMAGPRSAPVAAARQIREATARYRGESIHAEEDRRCPTSR
jgi:dimethylaniline monooxygenase (N-oxide forming)